MIEYKKKFTERTGNDWVYQTSEVEAEYQKYISEQKIKDKHLQAAVMEERTLMGMQDFLKQTFSKKTAINDDVAAATEDQWND